MKSLLLLLSLFFSVNAFASFMPENELWREDGILEFQQNLDEKQFSEIIDQVNAVYAPIVEKYGAKLTIRKLWTNSTVNANAQKSGKNWIVQMYGGLARRPEVTPDGFALVVCHEVEHLLGGFPFYTGSDMAVEGQSDYAATQSCAKEIWGKKSFVVSNVSEFAKAKCDEAYSKEQNRAVCYRSVMGGKSLATLLATLGGENEPQFETPDQRKVNKTYDLLDEKI